MTSTRVNGLDTKGERNLYLQQCHVKKGRRQFLFHPITQGLITVTS
jgi:hypothetical protein